MYKCLDFFQDCIGAIDGTHIPALITGRDVNNYRDRHGIISQNVLAVVTSIWNSYTCLVGGRV